MGETLAVAFADLRGLTALTVEKGDEAAYRLAQDFIELIRQQVEKCGGRFLKTYGDGATASFHSRASQSMRQSECSGRFKCATREPVTIRYRQVSASRRELFWKPEMISLDTR